MTSSVDTPPSQFLGIFVRQVPVVSLVQNTIRKGTTRPNGEEVSFKSRPIRIDVVYLWALYASTIASGGSYEAPQEVTHSLVPTADHRTLRHRETISLAWATMDTYHAQPHPLITVHQIAEILAGSGDRDPLLVSQLVKSALNTKIRFPILTISYTIKERQDNSRKSKMIDEKVSPAPPAIVPSR